jgi:hypothetical protein
LACTHKLRASLKKGKEANNKKRHNYKKANLGAVAWLKWWSTSVLGPETKPPIPPTTIITKEKNQLN